MSVDRVDRTWSVTTRLPETRPDKPEVSRERLRKIRHVAREGRNVGGPSRSNTGHHDPSNETRPDKPEVSSQGP